MFLLAAIKWGKIKIKNYMDMGGLKKETLYRGGRKKLSYWEKT